MPPHHLRLRLPILARSDGGAAREISPAETLLRGFAVRRCALDLSTPWAVGCWLSAAPAYQARGLGSVLWLTVGGFPLVV